jgi:hypothetical protein
LRNGVAGAREIDVSGFADQLLLQFLDNNFVRDLLTSKLGLAALFNTTYEVETVDLRQLDLAAVQRKEFVVPAFETIRTSGTDERIIPTTERVKVDRTQPRHGRLAWIDVFLSVLLATKVQSKKMPIESITAQSLLDKVGGASSIAELKTKLGALYPPSVVDAFFKKVRITSINDFKSRPTLFLEFAYKAPPPFDPADPRNARDFHLNVCVQFQPELKINEALQTAKLSRSILENEYDSMSNFDGGEIKTPYAFVVIFADAAVVDGALPNLTAAQIKAGIKDLFQGEHMLAHFA